MRLRNVQRFRVRRETVLATEERLRRAGGRGDELFLFWSGVIEDDVFSVRTLHQPRQTCHHSGRGVSVTINGDALHEQAMWLAEHAELLAVQIHAHPDDAFHSESDDEHASVTLTGAVSIVLPDFARRPIFDEATRVFRLSDEGWARAGSVSGLFTVRD